MNPLKLGDFCPYNRWSDNREWYHSCGLGAPTTITDHTTGQVYWRNSNSAVRLQCAKLAVVSPIFHLIAGIWNAARLTYRIVSLAPVREMRAQKAVMVRVNNWLSGNKQTHPVISLIQDLARLVFTIPIVVGLELSALYGIINPHDGRKLYTSLERLLYPHRLLSNKFVGNITWTNRVMEIVTMIGVGALMMKIQDINTYAHEYGHYLGFKNLFYTWNEPKIVVHNNGGHCEAYPFYPKIFSWSTSSGLLYAAGPFVDQLNIISCLAVSRLVRHRFPLISSIFAQNSYITAMNALTYACMPGSNTDYNQMSSLFSIPKSVFIVALLAIGLPPFQQLVPLQKARLTNLIQKDPSIL